MVNNVYLCGFIERETIHITNSNTTMIIISPSPPQKAKCNKKSFIYEYK